MGDRYDETWHRLREWTNGQAPSERLAAQILINQGFSDVDPSHPLGGKDGGKDAIAKKDGKQLALYNHTIGDPACESAIGLTLLIGFNSTALRIRGPVLAPIDMVFIIITLITY
jgi:hypothetical protein